VRVSRTVLREAGGAIPPAYSPPIPTLHEQILYESTNPSVVTFHNSLDDTNASVTPRYPQNPHRHPFHPAVKRHNKTGVTFSFVLLCRKNFILPLTSNSERLYL
jgi:hypothetical protein